MAYRPCSKRPPRRSISSGLGQSSLDFEVRLFVPAIADMFTTRHAYFMALEENLREANIEIPFPQRDVHNRSEHFKPAQT